MAPLWNISLVLFMFLFSDLPVTSSVAIAICPSNLPCSCSIETGKECQALRLDCSKVLKDTGEIPDFSGIKSSQINYLNLSYNNIREIKAEALGLNFERGPKVKNVPKIILDGNPLEDISAFAFRGIRGDVDLSMKSCGLEEIPLIALKQIKDLKMLTLASNKIDIIPDKAFSEFKKLATLDLSQNSLISDNLNENTFYGLEDTLEEINLAHSSLTTFPSEALKNLKKIKEINLNRNSIKSLPAYIFQNFSTEEKSMHVSLNENKMSDIDSDAFKRNETTLEIVDLSLWDNELDNADFLAEPCSSVFGIRKAAILLSANPLFCDCQLYDLVRNGFYSVKGRCEAPEDYKNVLVDVLFGNDLAPTKARYAGDFGKKAQKSCAAANLTETDLSCVGEPKLKPSSTNGFASVHDKWIAFLLGAIMIILGIGNLH